ncbi:MAG: hypothetical protein ACJ8FS_09815 [Sphingomicrobium sp.]
MGYALTALALAGCGGQAMGESDRFAPGKWQLEAWMESDQGSTRGKPGATLSDTVDLTAEDAADPPISVFFSHFYHGVENGNIRFARGKVEGSFHQRGVDDISAQDVSVGGTYGRDHFHVTFAYKAFGMTINQVVEGKLVEAAH